MKALTGRVSCASAAIRGRGGACLGGDVRGADGVKWGKIGYEGSHYFHFSRATRSLAF